MPNDGLSKVLLFALCLAVVFFLAAVVVSRVILQGETVSVPDLEGRAPADARAVLAKKDLVLSQEGSESSDTVERGRIIRQDPRAGSKIQAGKPVRVVLSGGSERAVVPEVREKMLEQVLPLLREAGLFRGRLSQVHTDRYAAGRVIAQAPPPGAAVERGQTVGLLVSQGAKEDEYVMPDLIGRPASRVVAFLKARDFRIADVRYVYYPGLEAGLVVRQTPPGGFRVQKRNLITIEVSRA